MKECNLESIKQKIDLQVSDNELSSVYHLRDGNYFKLFNIQLLELLKQIGIDMEKKILSAKKTDDLPELIIPTMAVYDRKTFLGYITPPAMGMNYTDYDHSKTMKEMQDLYQYAKEYHTLEDAVKRAHKHGIVFPDLLTCNNLFIHHNKYSFIDYDGIQIGNFPVLGMSTSLGNEEQYFTPKYLKSARLFNSNLDKKSLILLYYLATFNVNLMNVDRINPYTNKPITLDYVLDDIGMTDYDLAHATYLAINDKTNDNVYLENLVFNIAEKYNLITRPIPGTNMLYKKLVRK